MTFKSSESSVQVLVTISGSAIIESSGHPVIALGKGEVAIVPAAVNGFTIKGQWSAELIRAFVGGSNADEPRTTTDF